MHPRANFELVRVDDPELFVVRVTGHLGTRERRSVEDFVRRCRETGKQKVVFDFAGLESLGGSVAKVLGDFATEMAHEGHPPWFIGASPVVQSFLSARFDSVAPRFAEDLPGAQAGLRATPDLRAKSPAASVATRDAALHDDDSRGARERNGISRITDSLDIAAGTETLRAEDLLAEDDDAEPASPVRVPDDASDDEPVHLPPGGTEPGVTRRHSYLTLADAEPLLLEVGTLREAKPILDGLLFGADLAQTCELFCVEGDRLVQVVSGAGAKARWLPGNGSVSAVLRRRAAPVDIVDLTEMELSDAESEVISDLNCPG